MDSTLLKRLEKIQALIDRAGTAHEAEAAAAAFERILLQHNISQEELATLGQVERAEYVLIRVELGQRRERRLWWKMFLLSAIADYHFCKLTQIGKSAANVALVGQASNLQAALSLYSMLIPAFERIARFEVTKAQATSSFARTSPQSWVTDFLYGVPTGLRQRFAEERHIDTNADENVNALVLVKDAELKEANDDLLTRAFNKSPKNVVSKRDATSAFERGVEVGRTHREAYELAQSRLALDSGA